MAAEEKITGKIESTALATLLIVALGSQGNSAAAASTASNLSWNQLKTPDELEPGNMTALPENVPAANGLSEYRKLMFV